MKIAVWSTGHSIADTVARAVEQCFRTEKIGSGLIRSFGKSLADCATLYNTVETLGEDFSGNLPEADIHIGYGILRGMADVFRKADESGKPWFNIDRGYWGANHFDGHYRISLRGTQQTKLIGLEPDYKRFDKLDIQLSNAKLGDTVIICPPTEYVKGFFNDIDDDKWIKRALDHIKQLGYSKYRIRTKENSLHDAESDDFPVCGLNYTFNCSLGWKWLARGIPCISDPEHSIVGAYQKTVDIPLHSSYEERRKLFALMASLQMTLEEMREGRLWTLMDQLLRLL